MKRKGQKNNKKQKQKYKDKRRISLVKRKRPFKQQRIKEMQFEWKGEEIKKNKKRGEPKRGRN